VAWCESSALGCAVPQNAARCRYQNSYVLPRGVLTAKSRRGIVGKRVVARRGRPADKYPFRRVRTIVRCATVSQDSTEQSAQAPLEGEPEASSFAEKLKFWQSASQFHQPRSSASSNGKYVIQNGDTLWLIASKHGLTVSELVELNPSVETNVNMIQVGNTLMVGPTKSGTAVQQVQTMPSVQVPKPPSSPPLVLKLGFLVLLALVGMDALRKKLQSQRSAKPPNDLSSKTDGVADVMRLSLWTAGLEVAAMAARLVPSPLVNLASGFWWALVASLKSVAKLAALPLKLVPKSPESPVLRRARGTLEQDHADAKGGTSQGAVPGATATPAPPVGNPPGQFPRSLFRFPRPVRPKPAAPAPTFQQDMDEGGRPRTTFSLDELGRPVVSTSGIFFGSQDEPREGTFDASGSGDEGWGDDGRDGTLDFPEVGQGGGRFSTWNEGAAEQLERQLARAEALVALKAEGSDTTDATTKAIPPTPPPAEAPARQGKLEERAAAVHAMTAPLHTLRAVVQTSQDRTAVAAVAAATQAALAAAEPLGALSPPLRPRAALVASPAPMGQMQEAASVAAMSRLRGCPVCLVTSSDKSLPHHASSMLLLAAADTAYAGAPEPVVGSDLSVALQAATLGAVVRLLEVTRVPLKSVVCMCPAGAEEIVMNTVAEVLPSVSLYAPANHTVRKLPTATPSARLPSLGTISLIGVSEVAEFSGSIVAAVVGEWMYSDKSATLSRPPGSLIGMEMLKVDSPLPAESNIQKQPDQHLRGSRFA